jgi:hypothetical protein
MKARSASIPNARSIAHHFGTWREPFVTKQDQYGASYTFAGSLVGAARMFRRCDVGSLAVEVQRFHGVEGGRRPHDGSNPRPGRLLSQNVHDSGPAGEQDAVEWGQCLSTRFFC